jgi:anthranilate/para-aminobenzoate synthase component II
LDDLCVNNVHKGRTDSLVLNYMAKRMALTVRTMEPMNHEQLPAVFSLTERHTRRHRIMLFDPALLLQDVPLLFVGFVSEYRAAMSAKTSVELESADREMFADLVHLPGLVAYSSLALRNDSQHDHWYNFVVFQNSETKMHLQHTNSHRHAAYQVAPQVYNWIRIHQGKLAHGLVSTSLQLRSTKHYVFENAFHEEQRPKVPQTTAGVMIYELTYA